jgi:hypothetical protein
METPPRTADSGPSPASCISSDSRRSRRGSSTVGPSGNWRCWCSSRARLCASFIEMLRRRARPRAPHPRPLSPPSPTFYNPPHAHRRHRCRSRGGRGGSRSGPRGRSGRRGGGRLSAGAPGEKPCGGAVPEHVLPRLNGFDPSGLPVRLRDIAPGSRNIAPWHRGDRTPKAFAEPRSRGNASPRALSDSPRRNALSAQEHGIASSGVLV